MTFSILAVDRESGAIGGAAATGSLCVGGWVLRGDLQAGMSASQGASPSTFWGEDVLSELKRGKSAIDAVASVTEADSGRRFRQLSAMSLSGDTAVYSGEQNKPVVASRAFNTGIVAGNMLSSTNVVDAIANTYSGSTALFAERLLLSLKSGEAAGSDYRGLFSAALLVLHPDEPPLSLRIDFSEVPLLDLEKLLYRTTTGDYAAWCQQVPTQNDKERGIE